MAKQGGTPMTPTYKPCAFYASGLPKCEGLTEDEIRHGFRLFFLNKPRAAEAFFSERQDIGLFVMGRGAILFLWAMLSLEEKDIDAAVEHLRHAEKFASEALRAMRSRSGWFSSGRSNISTDTGHTGLEPKQVLIHYEVMSAECVLLTAILQLLGDSLISKVKAGLNIKSAWGKLSKLAKEVGIADDITMELDRETRCAINFSVGTFNLVTSVLPPKLMRVASMLGFPCDRALGIRLLFDSFKADGVRSPIAGLALLTHHLLLQTSFEFGNHIFREQAEAILSQADEKFPDSGFFNMMRGRLCKLTRQQRQAIPAFHSAKVGLKEWLPMVHMCMYELGFAHLILLEYEESLKYWQRLAEENDWSKIFYTYLAGICQYKMGQEAEAKQTFAKLETLERRLISGKQLPVDRFALRNYEQYIKGRDNIDLILPHLELIFFWAGFLQAEQPILEKMSREAEAAHDNLGRTDTERLAVAKLISGALAAQLKQFDHAEQRFLEVIEMRRAIEHEVWTVPYARYELAILYQHLDGGGTERVQHLLHKAFHKTIHNFDLRLHVRCHLALYQIKHSDDLGLKFETASSTAKAPHNEPAPATGSASATSNDSVKPAMADLRSTTADDLFAGRSDVQSQPSSSRSSGLLDLLASSPSAAKITHV